MVLVALQDFFDSFPGFTYAPGEPAMRQWIRLCRFKGWINLVRNDDDTGEEKRREKREQRKKSKARRRFKDALVEQFNAIYGLDEDSLESWQKLCERIGINPIPNDLETARQTMLVQFVNLVDLVDRYQTNEIVTRFDSLQDLRDYTIHNELYFPRDNAYAGGVLKYLLREIHTTYNGARRPQT